MFDLITSFKINVDLDYFMFKICIGRPIEPISV